MYRSLLVFALLALVAPNTLAQQRKKASTSPPGELAITMVRPSTPGRILPGDTVDLLISVRNEGSGTARFALMLPPTHPGAAPVRSETHTQGPGQRGYSLRVKVDPLAIRSTVLEGMIMLVDPNKPKSAPYLAQAYRDGNNADNVRRFSLTVEVEEYDVTATVTDILVHEDCYPGAKKSRWYADMSVASLKLAYLARNEADLPSRRPFYVAGSTAPWPAPAKRRSTFVGSGERVRPNLKLELKRVAKDRMVTIVVPMQVNNGPAIDQRGTVGTIIRVVKPTTWRYNRAVSLDPLPNGAKLANCGSKPFTVKVSFRAIPLRPAKP